MLTADVKNVANLFERVGVNPFDRVPDANQRRLDKLVTERGQIVHTGKAPPKFRKKNATDWRAFVQELAKNVDTSIAVGAKDLVGGTPW
jgi:hypothetical protein